MAKRGRTSRGQAVQLASPWLFGPAADLLFGCGAIYTLLFVGVALTGSSLREAQPAFVFPFLVLLLSTPHYGATLLRVYERREDRQSYVVFALYATLAVALLFVAGLYSPLLGSLLFTVYITWSPWHYTGQNYGISVLFLRRRGVALDGAAKKLLYASFGLSYAIFFLAVHAANGGTATIAGAYAATDAQGIQLLSLGIPRSVVATWVPVVAVAYAGTLVASAALLLRRARARDLLPSALLALTQALWFSLPYFFQPLGFTGGIDPLDPRFHDFYLIWIALGHATQYLWVTAYYARNTERWEGMAPYYGKVLLAGCGIWFLPWLFFAPGALGRLSSEAGLLAPAGASWFVLLAAINIHHFILDGAIWKLRNPNLARVLIRKAREAAEPVATPAAGWGRRAVWGVSSLALCIAVFAAWGRSVAFPRALEQGENERARVVLDRLAWVGQDMAGGRRALGSRFRRAGDADEALRQYQRSAALDPTPEVFFAIGNLRERQRDWRSAAEAYEAGLRLDPDAPRLALALRQVNQVRALMGD